MPPYLRVVELSACVKLSKISPTLSSRNPDTRIGDREAQTSGPVSSGSGSTRTSSPPRSVNLIALPSRLIIICRSRFGSPIKKTGTLRRDALAQRQSPSAVERTSTTSMARAITSRRSKSGCFEFDLAGFDFRKVENIVDQVQQTDAIALKDIHTLLLFGSQRGAGQHVGHPDDGVQRRPNLMAHGGQKIALGLRGPIRLVPLLFEFAIHGNEFAAHALDFFFRQFEIVRQLLVSEQCLRQGTQHDQTAAAGRMPATACRYSSFRPRTRFGPDVGVILSPLEDSHADSHSAKNNSRSGKCSAEIDPCRFFVCRSE